MKRKMFIAILFSIFCFSLFSACTSVSRRDTKELGTAAMLEPQLVARFSDIPVPSGFKLSYRDSYSFENPSVRVGILKYEGKANIDQVANFYKEQMPMYNWNLLNVLEYGERLMNFDRENETCVITLIPKGSAVFVTVALGPKPSFSAKKPGQAVK